MYCPGAKAKLRGQRKDEFIDIRGDADLSFEPEHQARLGADDVGKDIPDQQGQLGGGVKAIPGGAAG